MKVAEKALSCGTIVYLRNSVRLSDCDSWSFVSREVFRSGLTSLKTSSYHSDGASVTSAQFVDHRLFGIRRRLSRCLTISQKSEESYAGRCLFPISILLTVVEYGRYCRILESSTSCDPFGFGTDYYYFIYLFFYFNILFLRSRGIAGDARSPWPLCRELGKTVSIAHWHHVVRPEDFHLHVAAVRETQR